MILAFYTAKGTWADRFIRYFTQSEVSHVELICSTLPNKPMNKSFTLDYDFVGKSFSSSNRDKGSRIKHIQFKSNNWEFVQFKTTKNYEKRVEQKITQLAKQNKGYSYVGLIGFLFRMVRDKKRLFCSQAVMLGLLFDNELARKTSPTMLKRFFSNEY